MDADCLIKLTKAGLKDLVADKYEVFIPLAVKREVVDAGKAKGCPDAVIVEKNLAARKLSLSDTSDAFQDGDTAVSALFQTTEYDAVATDDSKLIRRLKMTNIPHMLPSIIILQLHREAQISRELALKCIDDLAPHISEEEFSTVKLIIEARR